MARDYSAMQRIDGAAARNRGNVRRSQRSSARAQRSGDGIGNSIEQDAGVDSDDPTNTAMFLDESEEDELRDVVPGTPQAYKRLEQLTVKSITRQRVSQTPGRPPNGTSAHGQTSRTSTSRVSRYDNSESPSKKGKKHTAALPTAIPMLTPAPTERAEPCRLLEANDETVPLSVRRIRSSRRAGSILDKIKQTSPKAAPGTTAPLLDLGTVARNPRPSLDPNFNKNRFSPFVLSKFARPQNGSSKPALVLEPQLRALAEPADDVCKTPESKPRRYGPGTPYNMLRALSEKSSESGSWRPSSSDKPNELRSGDTQEYGVDPFMSTPVKQRTRAANESVPRSEHRQRIETLRKFFDKHLNDLIPNEAPDNTKTTPPPPRRNNAELLISFDTADQRRGETSVPYTSHISQASSIRQSDGPEELLQSPSPLRPHRSLKETVNGTVDNDSATSLLLSFTSKQDIDGTRPIPFLLNQIEQQQQQDEQWTGDRSNLIDLSSRLNSSIHALNHGLREQLARTTAATNDQANLTPTAEAEEISSARAINSSAPGRDRLIDTSIRTETSQQSELEGQVETLRKTMEETKSIVFSIQSQLGQQQQTHVAEDTKLGDIVRLLGALDMRLHMLEDRQRLDQSVNGSAAGSPMARRTNAGSTKMHPNNTQSQDLLSRLGQFIVHCLSQYPLMIIGALFIILISELLLISGFRLDLQSLNGYGRYAMDEVKRHINMPHPPS